MRCSCTERRDAERGVAMTECAIALPVILLLFFACAYFHGLLRARLAAQRAARAQAWVTAQAPSCVGDGTVGEVTDLPAGAATYVPSGGAWALRYGRADASVARELRVPRILGNDSGRARGEGRVTLTCNEQANLEGLSGVIARIFDAVF